MSDADKNLIDIILAAVTMVGAAVAFIVGLFHWRRGQAWHRAEQLDKFIQKFETDELLKLSTVVLDWSSREVRFQDRDFVVRNDEALLALRDHRKIEDPIKFPSEQPHLRDAYDALLAFFNRLELAASTNLISVEPAKAYFSYWVKRFVTFDQHPDKNNVLVGVSPEKMVAEYIRLYGDASSMTRLCKHFDIEPPVFEVDPPQSQTTSVAELPVSSSCTTHDHESAARLETPDS